MERVTAGAVGVAARHSRMLGVFAQVSTFGLGAIGRTQDESFKPNKVEN